MTPPTVAKKIKISIQLILAMTAPPLFTHATLLRRLSRRRRVPMRGSHGTSASSSPARLRVSFLPPCSYGSRPDVRDSRSQIQAVRRTP